VNDFSDDIVAIQSLPEVEVMLKRVCAITGMGFAAVARVTTDRWVACQVLDRIEFGLNPGDELEIKTTICDEIRASGRGRLYRRSGDRSCMADPSHAGALWLPKLYLDADRAGRRQLLRDFVRDRSGATDLATVRGRSPDGSDGSGDRARARPDHRCSLVPGRGFQVRTRHRYQARIATKIAVTTGAISSSIRPILVSIQ